ncbi:MAG: biotin--[acetyl-CoA-carboxylase] ligase [Robiginitomaculum sp.]|nr:biotin--[acetyl-CoA-carboxylase] ligase [Robiginitomaculum sp.]
MSGLVRLVEFDEIDSTNAEAKRLAAKGDFGPVWITAKTQSQGVGRRGREWVSQRGNLFATGLYPVGGDAASAARLSFVAALAVYETIDYHMLAGHTQIKWPNDVLVGGKKVSGILLESGTQNDQRWIAVGIGINLVAEPKIDPDSVNTPVAALASLSSCMSSDFSTLVERLMQSFETWRQVYEIDGFLAIRSAWLERAQGMGEGMGGPVTARLPNQTITGTAIGLDADGALEIKTTSGELVRIHAGDVFFS